MRKPLLPDNKWSNIYLLISLLTIIIITLTSGVALNSFYAYKKSVSKDIPLNEDTFHFFFRAQLYREWLAHTVQHPLKDIESTLKTYHLSIDQKDLNRLNADLPQSGKQQLVEGFMRTSDGESTHNIKVRYRGDNNFHWLYPQKSLRIKVKDNSFVGMEKEFNLINHPNWYFHRDIIAYDLSRKLGLITPNYHPVRLFINGDYKGVYIYLSQVNESLLRQHKVMPGSIYFGDSAALNERGVRNLWDKAGFWVKKSSRNAEQKHNREDINFFIAAQHQQDEKAFYDSFVNYFDQEKYNTFIAIDRIVGTSHHDYGHNHKVYFDPYKGKFEPIEWDVREWTAKKDKDISANPLLLRLKNNPILDAEIDRKAFSILNAYNKDFFSNEMDRIIKDVWNDLSRDHLKDNAIINHKISSTWVSIPFTMKEYKSWMAIDKLLINKRIDILQNLYESTTLSYSREKISNDKFLIKIKVDGEAPATLALGDNIELVGRLPWNLDSKPTKNIRLYPGRKFIKDGRERHSELLGRDDVINVPQYYEIIVKAEDPSSFKSLTATNYITGKPVTVKMENVIIEYDDAVIHPKDIINRKKQSVNFSGTVKITETLEFDEYTNVSISAGTTFHIDKGKSLFFYGKVVALGTKEKPIKFMSADLNKPWGIVAVQGKSTKGSIFNYVEFENGSTDSHRLINYTAPFNIHDTDWFEVTHCRIGRNYVGDDAMHVAYASGIINGCEFYDSRSDGLDIDISDVTVTNNVFYNIGNDGLDIMTTKMRASNNLFIDIGDKGISIGEWSDASIKDSFFLRNHIGMEIKDKSTVSADNVIFVDSTYRAVNLYNKNKRYDTGGFLEANHLYLLGNLKIKQDKRSKAEVTHKLENDLPDLSRFEWYSNNKHNSYRHFVNDTVRKYSN